MRVGARLVLDAAVAHHVHEVRARHRGRGRGDEAGEADKQVIQRARAVELAEVVLGKVGVRERRARERALGAHLVEHAADPHAVLGVELFERLRHQAQAGAQLVVHALHVAGGRRQVVRANGGQRQRPVLVGRAWVVGIGGLEPQDRRAEHTGVAQHVLHPRLEGAQVLADHHGACALRLKQEDAHHRPVVVVHVQAVSRLVLARHPEQAEQAQDVVDADAAGVAQHRAQQVAPRAVSLLGECLRVPRRLGPVLPLLGVHVRRRANRGVGNQRISQRVRVRAVRVNAHGEVRHDADAHAGGQRAVLGDAALLVRDELQPHVELDRFLVGGLRRVLAVLDRVGLDGAPLAELAQALALVQGVQLEIVRAPRVLLGQVEQLAQDRELHLKHGVAVQRVGGVVHRFQRADQLVDLRARFHAELGELGDCLDGNVDGIDKAARGGEVRGVLHRRDGLRRVHRVDQQVVRALGGDSLGDAREVFKVADAPGLRGAHGVELRHHAVRGPALKRLVGGQAGRHNNERADLVQVVGLQVQLVPTFGQVAGDVEGRLAPDGAVCGGGRRRPVLVLVGVARGPVLQADPAVRVVAVLDVDVEVLFLARGGDHGEGQRPGREGGRAGVDKLLELLV